jgi:hypothetical protein
MTATQSGASATSKIPVTGFGGAATTGSSDSNTNNNNNNQGAGVVFAPSAGLGLVALFGSVFVGFASRLRVVTPCQCQFSSFLCIAFPDITTFLPRFDTHLGLLAHFHEACEASL